MSDYKVGDTIYHHFSTRAFATGIPTTLIGTPVAEAYEEANATGITAGVSLTIDHGETGHHLLTVVATGGNSFETGKSYGVSLTAGTVGGVSVVGEVILNFTLEKSPAAQDLANGTDGLGALKTLIDTVDDLLDTEIAAITAAVITNAAGADIAADIIAMKVDTASILVDTMTTLQAELDAIQAAVITNAAGADVAADIIAMKVVADAVKVVTDKMVFTVANLLDSNMLAIAGTAGAATNLERGANALVLGVCEGVPTTTNIPTDLTETTIDHYKGRYLTFTTGPVAGQGSDITGYAADGALTVTALTNAPDATDKFVIS